MILDAGVDTARAGVYARYFALLTVKKTAAEKNILLGAFSCLYINSSNEIIKQAKQTLGKTSHVCSWPYEIDLGNLSQKYSF